MNTWRGTDYGHAVAPLAVRQRDVLMLIQQAYEATGEAPSMRCIARRLSISLRAVQDHLNALYRKGWLRSPDPGGLYCTHPPKG